MIAPEYFNNHIAVEGEIIVKRVPNDTGSVLVWNSVTKKISIRTHAEIVSDLNVVTTNTQQSVTAKKWFYTSGGNGFLNHSLGVLSEDGSHPGIAFYKSGTDTGNLIFTGETYMFLRNDNQATAIVDAKGYLKSGSDDHHVLTGGGGHKAIADFSLTDHTHKSLNNNDDNTSIDVHTTLEDNKFKFINHLNNGSSANLFSTFNNANTVLAISTHPGGYGQLLGFNSDGNIFTKVVSAGNYSPVWQKIAYENWVNDLVINNYIPYSGANQTINVNQQQLVNADLVESKGYRFTSHSVGSYGQVTTGSSFFAMAGDFGYGISTNQGGGLDIMANQNGQPIRMWAGNSNDDPFYVAKFGKDLIEFYSPLYLSTYLQTDRVTAPNLQGSQVFQANNTNLYIGNESLPNMIFESDNDLIHYKNGFGNGNIWTSHNFNPNNYWHTGNFTQAQIDSWNNLVGNSGNFVTLNTEQTVAAKKVFAGGDGNGYTGASLMINGNGTDAAYPTLSFHQPGHYAGTVSYRGNGFYFMNINGDGFDYIRTAGYIKDGSDDNHLLLGGGGHKAISDFVTSANLNEYLPSAGGTMTGMINFDNNVGGIMGQIGDNDFWRVYGNTAGSNAGYLEIATADDGNEPIYVRQYAGVFANIVRTATLLDESGNTSFPGTIYSQGLQKAGSDNSMLLLGGGGHQAVSDFALNSQLGSYITTNTTQTVDATKTIGFQNTLYSGWDRSSVVNPQMGPISLLNLALQGAYPLYGDEEFRYGTNNIYVYNNYGNGTVTMEREAASDLPNRSGMQLRFNYDGNGATPGLGGFVLGFNARANAVFIQKFMAKLPVGYTFNNAENPMGDHASVNWLTPRAGTGKWETYVRAVMCGTGTYFSSGGHVYVEGPDTAMEFTLAFAEVYEINSSVFSRIKEAFYAKNETIHFNGAISDLITVGDSYAQRRLLSTSWDGTNGDQILLRVPGSQNNGAYLRYSQNGTLNGNIGVIGADNLAGGQILNPQGDNLYIGNSSLPNIVLQTATNTHFNYAGVGSIYTFNVNGVYLDRNINFNQDNSGVNFFEGGKIYKKSGGGVYINRGNNGLDPRIENADGSQSWMIFHEGNHNPFKNLRNIDILEVASESGVYRQEGPSSGFNYTTTLNLNSADGRQQLSIERTGGGMKFRGSSYGSGDQGWTKWNDVLHSGNFSDYINSYAFITQSNLNSQLSGYATLAGVQTFTNTNTFLQSPVIPNGTLGSHAVNVNQLNTKANALENATAIGFSSGSIPTADGVQYPYLYHSAGLHVALATQSYTQTNFLSTPNGTSVIISGSNLNDYLKTGFYRGSGLINAPFNNGGWWYVVIETHDSTWVKQTASSFGSGNVPNVTYQRTMAGGVWSAWVQIWTEADFTVTNIQQWNSAYQNGLRLNEEFTTNSSTGLYIADSYFGGESGIIDKPLRRLLAAKTKEYYFYGSEHNTFDGLNFNTKRRTFGMGREANGKDKLTVEGSVKASRNFKSEEERPDTLFIPNGQLATLRDEIINDESDYAIRLDPHEYEIDGSGYLEVYDRNRLIHIIGEQIKMVVNFKEIFPKQQIVIYNFDQYGGSMAVQIQSNTIYNIDPGCFLRLYVTNSLRVIVEKHQSCGFVW